MRYIVIVLVATLTASVLYSQDEKSTKDAQVAFDLYKKRVSEGAQPTLLIKNGESKLTESTALYAGEFSSPPPKPLYLAEIQALKEQIEALKKLNDGLEQELAACKSEP